MNFYRYTHRTYFGSDIRIELNVFILLRETDKGYWIIPQHSEHSDILWKEDIKKWIPKKSKKRFAYPTKSEALQNLVARTERYVLILSSRLRRAEQSLRLAKQMTENNTYERNSL